MIKNDLIVTNIAISVNKSALSVQKVPFSVRKVPFQSKKVPFQSFVKCPSEDCPPCPSDLPAPLLVVYWDVGLWGHTSTCPMSVTV